MADHQKAAEAIVNLMEYVVEAAPSTEAAVALGTALLDYAQTVCTVIPDLQEPLEQEAQTRSGVGAAHGR